MKHRRFQQLCNLQNQNMKVCEKKWIITNYYTCPSILILNHLNMIVYIFWLCKLKENLVITQWNNLPKSSFISGLLLSLLMSTLVTILWLVSIIFGEFTMHIISLKHEQQQIQITCSHFLLIVHNVVISFIWIYFTLAFVQRHWWTLE